MATPEEVLEMATRKAVAICKDHKSDSAIMAVREGILFGITYQAREATGDCRVAIERVKARGATA